MKERKVEALYTGEKWADGTDVVRVTMNGNTGELINLICTLATQLMEDHASQNADKQAIIAADAENFVDTIRSSAKKNICKIRR